MPKLPRLTQKPATEAQEIVVIAVIARDWEKPNLTADERGSERIKEENWPRMNANRIAENAFSAWMGEVAKEARIARVTAKGRE